MAMLKADIDSGATGDKTRGVLFDPGMPMLGTCEEAAGTPLRPDQIAWARLQETRLRWKKGSRKTGAAHNKQDGFPTHFVGFIVAIGAIFATALSIVWG